MASAFDEAIRDEYRRGGARGVACASVLAFGEFFTVALPRHLASDWLIAGTLSLIVTSCVLGSLVGIMTAHVAIPAVVHGCH